MAQRSKRRSTLDDVARLAGVSPITVSRALRKPDMVSSELQARIQGAVSKLAYVPNLAASRLASQRSHSIGVVVPTLYNVIFADYLRALDEVLIPAGFQVIVVNSRYSEQEEEHAIRTLLGQRVEAVIMVGVKHSTQTRQLLKAARLPIIETFQISPDPLGINIGLDQQKASHEAASLLIGTGLKRLHFIMGQNDARAVERLAGYRQALADAGLDPAGRVTTVERTSSVTLGSEMVRMIHDGRQWPEALCCIDDNIALGALHECARLGLKVPDDIMVMGFHDLEFAASATPSLSSVLTHRYKIGRMAAGTALTLIGKGRTQREVIDVGYEIVQRESTGKITRK